MTAVLWTIVIVSAILALIGCAPVLAVVASLIGGAIHSLG